MPGPEKVYFIATNNGDHIAHLWSSGAYDSPQEAADAYFRSLKDEKAGDAKHRAACLKALNSGCARGILLIQAWFRNGTANSYTMSSFGPEYRLACHLAEEGGRLPGKGTEHFMPRVSLD